MLIDFLTERQLFSNSGLGISILFYFIAGAVALLLRRVGQVRGAKKCDFELPSFGKVLWRDLPSELWNVVFFLVTGCLKGTLKDSDKTTSKKANRAIFSGGLSFILLGFAASFLLFTVLQDLQIELGGSAWEFALLGAKALTAAHISLFLFSVIPFPGSDIEFFLRNKEFGPKEKVFRKDGVWPFFLFCVLGLLLACITVPLGNGAFGSLSGILTLFPIFPILLIGG